MSVCAKFQLSSWSRSGWKVFGSGGVGWWNTWLLCLTSTLRVELSTLGFDINITINYQFLLNTLYCSLFSTYCLCEKKMCKKRQFWVFLLVTESHLVWGTLVKFWFNSLFRKNPRRRRSSFQGHGEMARILWGGKRPVAAYCTPLHFVIFRYFFKLIFAYFSITIWTLPVFR